MDYNHNNKRSSTGRIKVGFVSYDFRTHAVGVQVKHMFTFFHRDKFEIFAYNVNPGTRDKYEGDEVYQFLRKTVEHMVDLGDIPVKVTED